MHHNLPRSGVDHRFVAVIASRVDEANVSLLDEGGIHEETVDDGCEHNLKEVSSGASSMAYFFDAGYVGVHDAPDRDGATVS